MKLVTSMIGAPAMLSSLPRHQVVDLIPPKHVGTGRASHPRYALSASGSGCIGKQRRDAYGARGRAVSAMHRRIEMRVILAAFIVAAGVGTLASSGASAAPANGAVIANASAQTSTVQSVMGGCGRGWHRGPRGGCRPN
jgi:hypothetical protein